MATISHVRHCDPESLVAFAADVTAQNEIFTGRIGRMNRDVDDAMAEWKGEGAAATSARALAHGLAANHIGEDVRIIAALVHSCGTELDGYRAALLGLVDGDVPRGGMKVDDTGRVTAPTLPNTTNSIAVYLIQKQLDGHADYLQSRIMNLLVRFEEAERKAAQAITNELQQLVVYQQNPAGPSLRPPVLSIIEGRKPLPTDPVALHAFWETLTRSEKDALWQHDNYLGNRDGIPVIDRDYYNRMKLEDEITRAEAGDPAVANKLGDLRTTASSLAAQNRYLMLLDTQTGRNAHAAVSIGNPDFADHVATYVPGTGTQPSKMSEDMKRCKFMAEYAKSKGAENPAVIAWIGYDTPPTPVDVDQHLNPFDWDVDDASNIKYADAAAPVLDRFQEGLRASHGEPPSYNSVVAHSYGTTVVGDAAAHGRSLDADAVVLVASPGTTVEHAWDLHLDGVPQDQVPKHIFATKAEHDIIQLALLGDPFGPNPNNPDFGAQVFASDPGADGPWGVTTDAHSQYWDVPDGKPCKSLVNIADIIAGHNPTVE
ncbi:alpha/beta hydrolase [Nocardia sp. NPDC004068]|uniref:alpha/beta hydrolase n=1 Tax=Nocardia sp. NPDC004068 TaxID=3364303 RepID=UPI0036B80A39